MAFKETITELMVRVGVDLSSLQRSFKDAEKGYQKMGRQFEVAGRKMSYSVTAPLLAIGGVAIKAAADAEEMQAKFDTVFKTVGTKVSGALDDFSKAVGRNKYELREMAGSLGDVLKPLGYTEEAAGDLSVQLTKLITDLSSFNNMPMDEALRRVRGTLIGAHENAVEFGVVINENTLKAELAARGWDKLKGSQLEQAKVQARINLLFAGTTDAQGDAERTADSFANKARALQARLGELSVEIGQKLLPFIETLTDKLGSAVSWFAGLSDGMKDVIVQTGIWAAALGPLINMVGRLMQMGAKGGVLAGIAAWVGISTHAWASATGAVEDYKGALEDLTRSATETFGGMSGGDRTAIGISYTKRLTELEAELAAVPVGTTIGASSVMKKAEIQRKIDAIRAVLAALDAVADGAAPSFPGGVGGAGGGGVGAIGNKAGAVIQIGSLPNEPVRETAIDFWDTLAGIKWGEIANAVEPMVELADADFSLPDPIVDNYTRMAEVLRDINEQFKTMAADSVVAFSGVLGDAVGQLATLQTGFAGFFDMVVAGFKRVIAQIVAAIVQQKILNALQTAGWFTGATGGFIGAAIGALAGIPSARVSSRPMAIQGVVLPSGDIALSVREATAVRTRLRL